MDAVTQQAAISVNYYRLLEWFWEEVPYMPGYKSHYGCMFLAIVDCINRNSQKEKWRETAVDFVQLINKISCSKPMYYQALDWLKSQQLITYTPGRNAHSMARFHIGILPIVEVNKRTTTNTSEPKPEVNKITSADTSDPTPEVNKVASTTTSDSTSSLPINKDIPNTNIPIPNVIKEKKEVDADASTFPNDPIEPEVIPSEQKKGKAPSTGSADPLPQKKEPSIVTQIKNAVLQFDPEYYWDAKNGASAKSIANKLRNAINIRSKTEFEAGHKESYTECNEQDIVNAFIVLVNRSYELAPFYQFKDLPTLNGRFNEILTQLKNGKSTTSQTNRKRTRETDAEFASTIDALADWKYGRARQSQRTSKEGPEFDRLAKGLFNS